MANEAPTTAAAAERTPRDGMAGENVAILVLSALLVGLLIGNALGRRQGLTLNQVALPGDPHDGMHDHAAEAMPSGMEAAGNPDAAMAASAPPAPETLDEARAMVEQMGGVDFATLVDLGNRKFDNGKWLLAIAFYEGAVKQQPDSPDVWCDLGIAYHQVDENSEALRCFDEALERQPEHLNSWYNRGIVFSAMGDATQARAALEKVLAIDTEGKLSESAKALMAKLGS